MLLAASPAFATVVENINFPVTSGEHGLAGDFNENVVTNKGDVLTGGGNIYSIDGHTVGSLCTSGTCTLSYKFGGYTLAADVNGTNANFNGGFVDFYANGSSTPFLNTVAAPEPGSSYTLEGALGAGGTQNTAIGLLNVVGTPSAAASSVFDTNSYANGLGGLSDLRFNISASPQGDGSTFFGSADAHYTAVPEPSELAMLGLGLVLVGFGATYRRRNRG
ncbi:MAG: PEP-CTERM sorting domain-containing protein [Salinisphaera sp.]|nr:PEP-CTERM sorting domain-containing protein [Salinisphaera sp.]